MIRAGAIALLLVLASACVGAAPDHQPQAGDPDATAGVTGDAAELPDAAVAADAACEGAGCVGPEVCATVGPLGRCDGDALWRCDGPPSLVDCAAAGDVCAYLDDDTGYACVDAASTGAHRVGGVIRWEDRALTPGALGAPVAMPARGTMVAVVDDITDELLTTVSAADDGSYVAYYDSPGGGQVRIAAYSRSRATARPVRVRNTSGYLHALGSEGFAAGSLAGVDVLITADSTAGGAWNALDAAVTTMDWLRAHQVATISPVYIYWQQGTASGSYYQGASNELHLDGDDGHDDVVALHELGHYIQDEYSASDNPGGAHDGSPADPRLAWGEGGATWFALALRGVPHYIDYSAGGGWSVELEDRVHGAQIGGAMSQSISEWMVAELMWDVGDGELDGDADPMAAGSVAQVMAVMLGYVVSPTVDRGRAGVDLVEWLDGWFMHHGLAQCAAMRALVRDRYGFPYDLAGPAGACPP